MSASGRVLALARRWPGCARSPRLWAPVGYLALLLAVFYPVWWGKGGALDFFGWDCLREYWPDLIFGKHAIAGGELPLWNPYALGGYAYAGDPQAAWLSPMNWLLWMLGWIAGSDGPWLIQVKVFAGLLIGLCGMHALCFRRTRSHAAAAIAAVVYIFGSPLLVHKNGAFLWPFLYLPWALYALERMFEDPRWRRGVLLGAAIWLCGTAGHPQGFFYDLVILFAYGLYRTIAHGVSAIGPLPARAVATLRWLWKPALAAALVALALLLPLYLPAAEAVSHSVRQHRDLQYVLGTPLPPRGLYELFVPNLDKNWQIDIYVGSLALVLGLTALLCAKSRAALGERIFWWLLAALGVLLALGGHSPVLPFFYDHVPGFSLFRIAYRHKLIFGVAIAIVAGDGAAAVARAEGHRRARAVAAGLCVAWACGLAAAKLGWIGTIASGKPEAAARWALILGGGSLAIAAAALVFKTRARALMWAALALLMLDLWMAGQRKIHILQRPPDPARDAAALAKMEGIDKDWRYQNDRVLHYATPYLYDVRALSGFINPVRLARIEALQKRARHAPILYPRLNVRYWVTRRRPPRSLAVHHVDGPIWEIADPTPVLRVYPRAAALPTKDILARMMAPAPLDTALVDPADDPPALPRGEGAPVDGQVIERSRNRLVLAVDAPWPGVAVINEPFYPGWEATVNGEPVAVFRANYALRGVAVPAGPSRIVLTFSPPGLTWLLVGFFLGLLACAWAIAQPLVYPRADKSSDTHEVDSARLDADVTSSESSAVQSGLSS